MIFGAKFMCWVLKTKTPLVFVFGAYNRNFLYYRNKCQLSGSEKEFRPPLISLRDAESAFCLISPPRLLAGFHRVCQCLSLGCHCVCVSMCVYLCGYVSVYPGVSVCPLCALPYFPSGLPCWLRSHALVSCILVGVSVSARPFCIHVCLCVFLSMWPIPCWPFKTKTKTQTLLEGAHG